MNSHDAKPSPAVPAIDEAAIAWLIERSEGLTAKREGEFAAWLAADERHVVALRRLEKTFAVLEEMPAFRAELDVAFRSAGETGAQAGTRPASRRRGGSHWLALGGLAAAIAFGLVWLNAFFGATEQRYSTAVDAPQTVTLSDGSVLELNAATSARVRFARQERRVDLEAGEAHFAVAPDAARPFTVVVDDVEVRAVGTAFNVRRSAAAVEVAVVEGKVEVKSTAVANAAAPLVQAGERAIVPHGATPNPPRVEKIDAAAIRALLSWQPAVTEFADEPLGQVAARFNRRNRVQLVVRDPELAACRIAGVFALDEVEAFVRLLERDGVLVADRSSENEIVLQRKH